VRLRLSRVLAESGASFPLDLLAVVRTAGGPVLLYARTMCIRTQTHARSTGLFLAYSLRRR
jgi:hypothetical protein